jgi:CubicO group peptidase (beta-lactamase class C family)
MKTSLTVGLLFAVCTILPAAATMAAAGGHPSGSSAGAPQGTGAGAVPIPDTAAGRQFRAWLKAFNSGDINAMRAFHEASGARDAGRIAAQDARFFDATRGLELRAIEESQPDRLVALVFGRLPESLRRLEFRIDPNPPHAVIGIGVRPAADNRPAKLSEPEMIKALDAYVNRLAAADAFSGTVVVAKGGKPIFQKAVGLAHKGYAVPNKLDTKFNLGSMNKMFTSVAIAQLVEQGKLAYADTIGKHLTDYPNKDAADKVTIHHLLTHTSGLADYFNDKYMEASKDRFRQIADFLPLFADKPLEFTPGERFRYSNAGFLVLGAIIEKVSGQSYFDYVRERIYKPAGMTGTDAFEMDAADVPNLAFGYTKGEPDASGKRAWKNNLFMHVVKGGPAGGGFSTAPDLIRFADALQSGKLIRATSLATILTGPENARMGPDERYGYGFIISTVKASASSGTAAASGHQFQPRYLPGQRLRGRRDEQLRPARRPVRRRQNPRDAHREMITNQENVPMKTPSRAQAAVAIAALMIAGPACVASAARQPAQAQAPIDAATRRQVIDAALKQLNDAYVFPEVARRMEAAIRKRVADKGYDDLFRRRAIRRKAHRRPAGRQPRQAPARPIFGPAPPEPTGPQRRREPTPEEREAFRRQGAAVNYGFQKVERLDGNIGYLDLRNFHPAALAGETAAAAMGFLAGTDALIVDLRRNGGGDPAMVQLLCSYLFAEGRIGPPERPVLARRGPDAAVLDAPVRPRQALRRQDVYVLTSKYTFSGAEEFTYNLKNLKRATIVGETTGGGANPGGFVRLAAHFGMFVPGGRAINPITKTNWEGTGVPPDVAVPPTRRSKPRT